MKKKAIYLFIIFIFLMTSIGCEKPKALTVFSFGFISPYSAGDALVELKSMNPNCSMVIYWVGDTNSNGKRYAEDGYSSKADFTDKRVNEESEANDPWELGLKGGTLELFNSKDKCKNRYEETILAAFNASPNGLNQYIFKYDTAIFRVSYDLSLEEALVYKKEMDEILNEEGVQYLCKLSSDGLPRAEEALQKMKEMNSSVSEITIYTEETDPNNRMGKIAYYTSKADFSDRNVEKLGRSKTNSLIDGLYAGGTLEIFDSELGCQSRCDYILENIAPDSVTIGMKDYSQPHQYIFKYKKALFRLTYSIEPESASRYKQQMDNILGEQSTVVMGRRVE